MMKPFALALLLAAPAFAHGAESKKSEAPRSAEPAKKADAPRSIGTATMEDGTIVLMLRAEGQDAAGDAMLTYPKSHKDYQMILGHLGGLKPGETKQVPPWPEPKTVPDKPPR
jgi:hypothetical protein